MAGTIIGAKFASMTSQRISSLRQSGPAIIGRVPSGHNEGISRPFVLELRQKLVKGGILIYQTLFTARPERGLYA